jgi:hypothetical protein
MREVRDVLPARSAPQIPSAQDAAAGCHRATLMEVGQVLGSTWDDRGATAPAPKMNDVVCAHNFFSERTKPILLVTVPIYNQ